MKKIISIPPRAFLTTLAATAFVGSAQAELVVANYEFEGDFSSSDTSSVTASDITIGAGLLSDDETGIEDGTTNLFQAGQQPGNPGSYFRLRYEAITQTRFNDDYIEFTVTPSVGQTLDFTSLSLDLVNFSGGAGFDATVYSSVVDGAIDDVDDDQLARFNVPGGSGDWTNYSVDLSAFTGITDPTVFRIEFFSSGNDGRHNIGVDNVVLTAVPEPSAALLVGLGMLVLLRRRR